MKRKIIFVLIWLAVWQAVSLLLHGLMQGAGPIETAAALAGMAAAPAFWAGIGSSFIKVLIGALLGAALGTVLGVIAFVRPAAGDAVWPIKAALPAILPAVLALLMTAWKAGGMMALCVSFLTAFPAMFSSVNSGLEGVDQGLLEMAQVFRVPTEARLKYIFLPEMKTKLAAAVPNAIGLAWRFAVAAEVIGAALSRTAAAGGADAAAIASAGSAGECLVQAFAAGSTAQVLACAVVLALAGLILEKGIGAIVRLLAGTGKK